jgi:hypothetical protein
MRLHKLHLGGCVLASDAQVRDALAVAAKEIGEHKFTLSFLQAEWLHVVDARQVDSWDGYRDVPRLGRKTRLKEPLSARARSSFAHGLHITQKLCDDLSPSWSALRQPLDTTPGSARSRRRSAPRGAQHR